MVDPDQVSLRPELRFWTDLLGLSLKLSEMSHHTKRRHLLEEQRTAARYTGHTDCLSVCPGPVYLITEFCRHGDLVKYLQRNKHTFLDSETHIKRSTLSLTQFNSNNFFDMKALENEVAIAPKYKMPKSLDLHSNINMNRNSLSVLSVNVSRPAVTVMEVTWT